MTNDAFTQKQLRTLQKNSDKSLQCIIDEAYRILGNPIILYDIDLKILARPKVVVTDDPVWNNHINGTIENSRDLFINEGFVHIMTGPARVVSLKSENIKYDRLFGKIFDNENNMIACVSVVASNKAFGDGDHMITSAICKMLSVEICKIPYYQNFAQKKFDTYIRKLIEVDYKDKTYFISFAEIIYQGLKKNIYVAVADISQCDSTYVKLDHYRDLFKQIRPAFKYAIYKNYVVFLISSNNEALNPKKALMELCDFFEQNNIYVGISTGFENLFEIPRYYAEAVRALNGREHNSNQHIFLYNMKMF